MEFTQFTLNLSFEAPVDGDAHSIKTPKKQKIKNIGLLDRKVQEFSPSEKKPSPRVEQIFERYSASQEDMCRSVARQLAGVERQASDGAWDPRAWEEKFYQILYYRRFLADPILYATGNGDLTYPLSWNFAPRNGTADLLQALQVFKQQRSYRALRLHLSKLTEQSPMAVLEEIANSLGAWCTKQPKPYPELQAILPSDNAAFHDFIYTKTKEGKQCPRVHAVELPANFARQALIYENVLRDLHAALHGESALGAVYFRATALPKAGNILGRDRSLLGAVNLAEFVDSSTNLILWDELRSALHSIFRLARNWRVLTERDGEPPHWIGLTGWAELLEKLEVDYDSPTARSLGHRLATKIEKEVQSLGERHGGPATTVLPAYSRFFSQLGATTPGVLSRSADAEAVSLLAMQEAFALERRGTTLAVIRKAGKMEVEDFIKISVSAAQAGWLGLRFL